MFAVMQYDTPHENARILSLYGSTDVVVESTTVLCVDGDVRVHEIQIWVR
jgi:hypothetical protein